MKIAAGHMDKDKRWNNGWNKDLVICKWNNEGRSSPDSSGKPHQRAKYVPGSLQIHSNFTDTVKRSGYKFILRTTRRFVDGNQKHLIEVKMAKGHLTNY